MARPPVCKLMDYGKFKYESAQKAREARRNQALTVIKEMRLRLKIDPHDYETKKGHVERFLKGGDKVKITVMFRGREQSRPEMGYRLLQRLAADVAELGFVESKPKQDGRNMVMVIAPHKNAQTGRSAKRDVPAEVERRHPPRRPAAPRAAVPPTAETNRRTRHAEEQDPQGHREARPGDRHRQAGARAHQQPAQVRAQVEHPHPAARRSHRHRAPGRQARPEAARPRLTIADPAGR